MKDCSILIKDQPDRKVPMALFGFNIDSGGYKLLARCFKPALDSEDEKRPAVIFVHGFPGNDQFIDLAQALRRAGFVCITFTARGAWGSHGAYRFETLLDDTLAAIDHVKKNADALSVDVNQIFLCGQSVGGQTVTRALASKADVVGTIIIAPCDMPEVHDNHREVFDRLATNSAPMLRFNEGEDVSVLYDELATKGGPWKFPVLGKEVDPKYAVLVIGGERDTTCPIGIHVDPLVAAFDEAGVNYKYIKLDTDHNMQNKRIEFIGIVYEWLCEHSSF